MSIAGDNSFPYNKINSNLPGYKIGGKLDQIS